MKVIFLRIISFNSIKFFKDSNLSYEISIKIIPKNIISSSPILLEPNIHCLTTWTLIYDDIEESSISIVINCLSSFKIELYRLTLPLKWFTKNTKTTEYYPMFSNIKNFNEFYITLEIHLSENGFGPFIAPESPLKVKLSSKYKQNENRIENKDSIDPEIFEEIPKSTIPSFYNS